MRYVCHPSALMETYQNAGLGKDTELGLIGEQRGVLNANRKRWADIERATVAYGYGITSTPLQIARAYATLGSFRFIVHFLSLKLIRQLLVNVFSLKNHERRRGYVRESGNQK